MLFAFVDSAIISGFHAGADDYVTKPFSLSVLFVHIQALLRRQNTYILPFNEIKIGNLVLNQEHHKVWYNKTELLLTLKEYNLLEYLMRHPNIVVERETLLEKIWDTNFESFSNVVDVSISRLRKKLQKITDIQFLETVRGVGFMLKA